MSAQPECEPSPDAERLESAADQAIAACGGDMRGAIKALIVANEFLEAENRALAASVSPGYARRALRERAKTLPSDRKDWYD